MLTAQNTARNCRSLSVCARWAKNWPTSSRRTTFRTGTRSTWSPRHSSSASSRRTWRAPTRGSTSCSTSDDIRIYYSFLSEHLVLWSVPFGFPRAIPLVSFGCVLDGLTDTRFSLYWPRRLDTPPATHSTLLTLIPHQIAQWNLILLVPDTEILFIT